jgi:hypothetical protein
VTRQRLGAGLVLGGSILALALQVGAPVIVPLYDGVVIADPYRYLHPAGDQAGDPTSASRTVEVVEDGVSPAIAIATNETPPQAQLIAREQAFELSAGATSLVAEIVPVDPPAPLPATGPILGNAYRFSVADQSGSALRFKPCNTCVSIALRTPDGSTPGEIRQFRDGAWLPVVTRHGGTGLYQANLDALGIVAIVATPAGFDFVPLVGIGGVALIFIAFIALLYLRARPPRLPAAQFPRQGGPPTGRIPSKRRGSRRPPSGRSDR